MRKNKNERGPLTPKKKQKTLFVLDGNAKTLPPHVADDLGFIVDLAGADEASKLGRLEGDWGYYVSRHGFGLVHCKVHRDLRSVEDAKKDTHFKMRIITSAQVMLNMQGVAEEALEMAAMVRLQQS